MGDRITVEELVKWLEKYPAKATVAFFVYDDAGRETGRDPQTNDQALELLDIVERPTERPASDVQDPETVLFLRIH